MPGIDDLLMQLQSQITRMSDPYADDRRRLQEQIASMNQPSWFSGTPLGQSLSSAFPGGEVPFAPGPGLAALGVTEREDEPMMPPEEIDPMRIQAEGAISTRETMVKEKAAAGAAKVEQLKERAKQVQLDELSSLVGDMPADKLFQIRAEARQRGRQGSLEYGGEPSAEDYDLASRPTGGGFTVAPDSPEIQQRLDDNAAWLADQPIRDAQFALTPEQAQRRPRQAELASDRLVGLQAAKIEERQVANQEALINAIGKGGKIPFETAMKLQTAGLSVPWPAMGASPDKVRMDIEDALAKAQSDVARIINDPLAASQPGASETIKYFQYVIEALPRYAEYLERGADPDEVSRAFTEMLQRYAQDSGAFAFWDANFAQQAAAPTEGQ